MKSNCFVPALSAVAFAAILVFVPRYAMATDVPQWSTCDIKLAGNNHTNGYADGTSLTATFTAPDKTTQTVKGFWNGGAAFVVRFTPTQTGTWDYTVRSSDSKLNDQSGTINATPAEPGNHGFLRIDPNHKYSFVWDDGTRYFMWGQSYYNEMDLAVGNRDWKTGIDKSAAYGMNKLRFQVYPYTVQVKPDPRLEFSVYPDYQPYKGSSKRPNRDSLNLAFWNKLDQVVQYLDSTGMVADLIVTTGYSDNRQFGSNVQNDRFVDYVVNRYAAYHNVIWCMANEWGVATHGPNRQTQEDFNRMGRMVRNNDPWLANGSKLRPLSIHQNTRIDFQFFGAGWPTFAIVQFTPRQDTYRDGDQWGNASIVHNLGHNMPVVNDEYAYFGDNSGRTKVTRTVHRNAMWGIAAAGGYGSSGDSRVPPTKTGQPEVTGDWYDATEYGDIKHLIDFFTTKGVEYWKMSSDNALKASSRSRDYVLAEPGRQYILYTATGGPSVRLNLSGHPGSTFNVWKYDPTNGAMSSLGTTTGTGWKTYDLSAANAAGGNDWVLLATTLSVPSPAR